MATTVWSGVLIPGAGISAAQDKGNQLLGATGNPGETTRPGMPQWLYQPFPLLSPGKEEAGNTSSKGGFRALSCSKVGQCWPRAAAHCIPGLPSMLSPRTGWMWTHAGHTHTQHRVGYLGTSVMAGFADWQPQACKVTPLADVMGVLIPHGLRCPSSITAYWMRGAGWGLPCFTFPASHS